MNPAAQQEKGQLAHAPNSNGTHWPDHASRSCCLPVISAWLALKIHVSDRGEHAKEVRSSRIAGGASVAPQGECQHFLGGIGQEIIQKIVSFSDMLFTKHWKQSPKNHFEKHEDQDQKNLLRTLLKMTGRKWSDIVQYPKWPLCGHRDVNSQWAYSFFFFFCQCIFYKDGEIANRS